MQGNVYVYIEAQSNTMKNLKTGHEHSQIFTHPVYHRVWYNTRRIHYRFHNHHWPYSL